MSNSTAPPTRCGEIEWIEANAFDLLKDYATAGRQYDTIVLDPPAFAKTKRTVATALRGYKELNLRALKMLRPGRRPGDLLLLVPRRARPSFWGCWDRLLPMQTAASEFWRSEASHRTTRSWLNVPETAYLKCMICQVIIENKYFIIRH